MKNKLTRDEALFKEKLEQVSFEYKDADWSEMQQSLDAAPTSSYSSLLKGLIGLVLLAGIVALSHHYFQSEDATESKNLEIIDETTPQKEAVLAKEVEPKTSPQKQSPEAVFNEAEIPSSDEKIIAFILEDSIYSSELSFEMENDSQKLEINYSESESQVLVREEQEAAYTDMKDIELLVIEKPCINQELKISIPKSLQAEYDFYRWFLNGVELPEHGSNLTHLVAVSGSLEISVEAFKNNVILAEKSVDYFVEEPIELDFRYEDLEDPFNDLRVILKAEENHAGTYRWDIDGKQIKMGKETAYEFLNKGIYDIRLIHQSANACQTEIVKPVAVRKDFEPFAPNAFTPDGDGVNDEFLIESFSELTAKFEMNVYAPNGDIVFYSKSPLEGWNGRKNNKGPVLPRATYVWKVNIQNDANIKKSFIGRVKIMDF